MQAEMESADRDYRSVWTQLSQASFRQAWVDAGGVRTRFVEVGQTGHPVVIFLHGTGGSLEAFCANLVAHGKRFHCFALDLVGSGYSDKPDIDYEISVYVRHLLDFMDAMGVAKASLVGVSLGSWIASRFALDHPDRTGKITLLSAAGLVANPNTMKQIKSLRSNAVENPTWENIRSVLLNLLFNKDRLMDDLIAVRRAIYRQNGMGPAMSHTLCLQVPEIRARNLLREDEWRAIQVPALVVGSLEDNKDYLDTARYVADVIPNARYVEMKEVAHWPQYEDSEAFNRISMDFLLAT